MAMTITRDDDGGGGMTTTMTTVGSLFSGLEFGIGL